ncbi:ECF transporter S component [Candidatus Epulonipiscium fishelsonii]|uniref:ECF transporter S component n=1 Tax=Candidatus Epulonipiscium fishelsonii TaxID=77094 RepID=A0ACC8XHY8_9FIRM|nr:ECF transporter S component [Epulopiscium sp. SCG-D08WGA-EpuloA1]
MNTRKMTLIGIGVAINIVFAFIALTWKLPIYGDSVGTLLVAFLLGPKFGILTGLCASMISGALFDVYAFAFMPAQIATGFFAGLMYKKGWITSKKQPLGVFVIALPTALLSAVIAAFVFGGITSAGSSYIVQMLKTIGFNDVASVFVIQILTDYLDEYVGTLLVLLGLKAIPAKFKII